MEGFVESSGEVLCVGCEDLAGCLDPWRSVGVVCGLVKGGGGGGGAERAGRGRRGSLCVDLVERFAA